MSFSGVTTLSTLYCSPRILLTIPVSNPRIFVPMRNKLSSFLSNDNEWSLDIVCRSFMILMRNQSLPDCNKKGQCVNTDLLKLRKISVDESLQTVEHARNVAKENAANVFSIKVSKNGGLRAGLEIARTAEENDIKVLMNSMLELGITQAASLHLGCVLDCLVDCGHAYMSTLRMSDDITDFSGFVEHGTAKLPQGPGLGVNVDELKIRQYLVDEYHVSI